MKNFNFRFVTVFFAISSMVQCGGGGGGDDDKSSVPERSGDEIPFEQIEHFDEKPDISADGQKIIFVSGRDKTLKVYKYERGGSPSRLTEDKDDLGVEMEASLSPDGQWVLVLANKDASVNLYLQDFDGNLDPQKISDSAEEVESDMIFSPDSELFAFLRRDAVTGNKKLHIGRVSSTGTVLNVTDVSVDDVDETNPAWIEQSGESSYILVTRSETNANFKSSLISRQITRSGDSFSVTQRSILTETLDVRSVVDFVGSSRGVFYAAPNLNDDYKREPVTPPGDHGADKQIAISSMPRLYEISDGVISSFSPPGSEVLKLSSSSDGQMGVWSMREAYACQENLDYGVTMVVFDNSKSLDEDKYSRLIPLTATEENKYVVASGVCNKTRSDESEGEFDRKIVAAKINANATSEAYTVVYVTHRSGDFEVYAFESANGEYTFYDVSNNRR